MRPDETDKQILSYLAEGYIVKEIAPRVNLSKFTVSHRLEWLRERYDARNNVNLVYKYFTHYNGPVISSRI